MIFDRPITNYRESDAGAWITSHADMETDDADDVYYLASCVAFLMEEKERACGAETFTAPDEDSDDECGACREAILLHRFHLAQQRPADIHQSAEV